MLDVVLGLHSLYSTVVRKAIFLDRDGTIIDNQGDLGDPKGVNIIDGAKEAIKSLADAGWLLIVITTGGYQTDVQKKRMSKTQNKATHNSFITAHIHTRHWQSQCRAEQSQKNLMLLWPKHHKAGILVQNRRKRTTQIIFVQNH